MRRLLAAVRSAVLGSDEGMSTAEYAVGTVAACSFAAILLKILTSGFGSNLLESLLSHVLQIVL